uniref:Uncharacterized protein n=1 Tax=viral metagenome TaxID=1070528 RepID=A0A6M3LZA0_9ZZZZ
MDGWIISQDSGRYIEVELGSQTKKDVLDLIIQMAKDDIKLATEFLPKVLEENE